MITEQDQDLLSQYVDEELDNEQNLEVKRRLLAEPEFNAHYQKLKSLDNSIKEALSLEDEEEMPEEFAKLLELDPEENETSVSDTVTKVSPIRKFWYLPVAASVAFVMVLTTFMTEQAPETKWSDIALQLNSQPSMKPVSMNTEQQLVVLQSFANQEGTWCREFMLQDSTNKVHGVACNENGNWRQVISNSSTINTDTTYATASSDESNIDRFINSVGGSPATDSQEQELIKKGWSN